MSQQTTVQTKEQSESTISLRSFITVTAVLVAVLVFCGALSYVIPQGAFARDAAGNILPDSYTAGTVEGIAPWRVITAPLRVFASDNAVTVIMISLFLLIMSGVFHLLEQTGGIKVFIVHIIRRFQNRRGPVICITVLLFMLFGSLFGMYEELITLLPLMLAFMLSLQMDTLTGLGVCLVAACFGFSSAITNPFSVGTAAQIAGISTADGMWLRILFFVIIYGVLCAFLLGHLRRIRRDPRRSLTYDSDCKQRAALSTDAEDLPADHRRIFRVYAAFFALLGGLLVAIAAVRALADYAIPLLAGGFLLAGIVAGRIVCGNFRRVFALLGRGAANMIPAVVLIAIASSVKLVIDESRILDTIMHGALQMLDGKSPFVTILLIYGLILFLQLFIGSASAKIFLIMPIILPITAALGISPMLVILTYCMADGFSDVILPTNPILLISLSFANVSYGKWLKWTWKLQLTVLAISVLVLFFGVQIGY